MEDAVEALQSACVCVFMCPHMCMCVRVSVCVFTQDAVEALQSACDAVGDARRHLAGVSDLERAVARLYSSTVAGASGRDASNVVLYEDAAKRKV